MREHFPKREGSYNLEAAVAVVVFGQRTHQAVQERIQMPGLTNYYFFFKGDVKQ